MTANYTGETTLNFNMIGPNERELHVTGNCKLVSGTRARKKDPLSRINSIKHPDMKIRTKAAHNRQEN
jgi:hypothetical protein